MYVEGLGNQWYNAMPRTGRVYRLIDEAVSGRSRIARVRAIAALGESDVPRAVRPLVGCCTDKDALIRKHAIEALRKLRSGRAVNVLIDRLGDRNELPAIRMGAARALAAIRSDTALHGLKRHLSDTREDPVLHSYIGDVLERLQAR